MINPTARNRTLAATRRHAPLIGDTIWSVLGEAMARGSMLGALLIVAHLLGPSGYGELGIIRTTIGTFTTLGGIGLGLTANRYIAEHRASDPELAGEIIGSTYLLSTVAGAIVAISVALFAPIIATRLLNYPAAEIALQLTSPLIFLGSINGAQTGILQGLHEYRRLAIANGSAGLLALVAMPVGAAIWHVNGAIAGLAIYTLINAVLLQIVIQGSIKRQPIKPVYSRYQRSLRILWHFSVPALLMGIATAPIRWLCEALLAKHAGFGQLGLFHGGMLVATSVIALVSTLNAPLLTHFSAGSQDGSSKTGLYVTTYGTWFLFFAVGLPLIAFPALPSWFLGKAYSGYEIQAVISLLLIWCGLLLYYQGIIRVVATRGSMWLTLTTNLIEGLVLLLAFLIIPNRSAMTLAFAYALSYVARTLVSVPVIGRQRIIPMRMLLDPYFILTMLSFIAIAAFNLRASW